MVKLLARENALFVRNDQCETGTVVRDSTGAERPVRKTTGWVTNSPRIAEALDQFQCRNRMLAIGPTNS